MPRPRGRAWSLAAAALLALAAVCAPAGVRALHEDQVGSFDWHKSFLGEANHVAFAGSKAKKRAFVATEQGAIGALDFNTGEIGACRARSRIVPSDPVPPPGVRFALAPVARSPR